MPKIYLKDEWPPNTPADAARKENVLLAARLMANAAMTAPVMGGQDQMEVVLIWGEEEQEKIARKMEELAKISKSRRWQEMFKSEAVMVRESDAILVIGNYRAADTPLDVGCGLCGGKPNCDFVYSRRKTVAGVIDHTELETDMLINGPLCMCRVSDLGEAVGSALQVAHNLLVDARPFMSVGLAALKLGYLKRSQIAVGILVAARQKNPFVDILPYYHMFSLDRVLDNLRKIYIVLRQVYWYDYRVGFKKKLKEEEEEE